MSKQDWLDAVDNYRIQQYRNDGVVQYLHAEAGTGSKYELATYLVQSDWRDKDASTMFLAVSQPWERVWTTGRGDWAFPNYVAEHWGPPRRSISDIHGGDLAAVVMSINLLKGHSMNEVVARMLEWA